MNELSLVFSGFSVIIAIGTIVYTAGIQRAQLSNALKEIERLRERDENFMKALSHVEIIWDALMKRGAAEGINKGLFTLNSPIKITNEARAMLEVLRPRLESLYRELKPRNPTEHDLGLEIEQRFGGEIVKEVCVPNGLNLMACIIIAIGVAKGSDTLDTILDKTTGALTL